MVGYLASSARAMFFADNALVNAGFIAVGLWMRDLLVLRLPLVGPVVHRSLISRWCDAVRLGVIGGMDLPAAMRTAADAVASNRLRRVARCPRRRIFSEPSAPRTRRDWEKSRSVA